MIDLRPDDEWLEADGLGGYAMGTVSGGRTRRYHALVLPATQPPTGRMALLNGCSVAVQLEKSTLATWGINAGPADNFPTAMLGFERAPYPVWRFAAGNLVIRQELFARRGSPGVVLRWTIESGISHAPVELRITPEFTGRDYHDTVLLEDLPVWTAQPVGHAVFFQDEDNALPSLACMSTGTFIPALVRRTVRAKYAVETERGLDDAEVLSVPGEWRLTLEPGSDACLVLSTGTSQHAPAWTRLTADGIREWVSEHAGEEAQREAGGSGPLGRSVDSFFVRRGAGETIVAGYPWFTDWGRDTFIALRGLSVGPAGGLRVANILREWSSTVDRGMLPNFFPDLGSRPEYNSVDASLWYCVVAGEALDRREVLEHLSSDDQQAIAATVLAIIDGYSRGTRYGIAADTDNLLRAGEHGWQLTWMDARSDEREVTPRIGKPVEIQALWYNALLVGARFRPELSPRAQGTAESFARRFACDETGALFDVVDCDHIAGKNDASIRPNMLLAMGGLPVPLLTGDAARRAVDIAEQLLWTPHGMRSLSPTHRDYCPQYTGDRITRDAQYHQGTVWMWPIGPFLDAWLNVRNWSRSACEEARSRFLVPLEAHVLRHNLYHCCEVADGNAPHTPRGCPFQAWSLGEYLRLSNKIDKTLAAAE